MTATGASQPGHEPAGQMNNGLIAARYVPLTDLSAEIAPTLLHALGRARIAAYLTDAPDGVRKRLFVAGEERADARTIVTSVLRADGRELPADLPTGSPRPAVPEPDVDYDVAFSELIADWHVDTHQAIREAERALSEQDANWRARLERSEVSDPLWLDEEHFVPPPPPPLPRLAAPTVGAIALLVASIVLLTLGGMAGLAPNVTLFLGVLGVLSGATILIMRLRRRRDEDDDDGAVL